MFANKKKVIQKKEEPHPDPRVASIEKESGISFADVKIHYASDKPKEFGALAYAYGNDVYLGSGQEKHLKHELGHVVQQRQGIVKPTMQLKGYPVNNESKLEKDADISISNYNSESNNIKNKVVQRLIGFEFQMLKSKVSKIDNSKDLYSSYFKTEMDGTNIEMITPPLANLNNVDTTVRKMVQKANRIIAVPNKPCDLLGITICEDDKNDGTAQPQINVDIDFSQAVNLDNFINDSARLGAFDGNSFYWKPAITRQTMSKTIDLVGKIRNFAPDFIQKTLKENKVKINMDQMAAIQSSITGLAQLIGAQYIQSIKEDELYTKSDNHYSKDIPILIKTSFIGSILSISQIYHLPMQIIIDILNNMINQQLISENIKSFDPNCLRDDNQHLYLNEELNKHPLAPKVDSQSLSIAAIAELRRAPILHFNQWVPFAINAFKSLDKYGNHPYSESSKTPLKPKGKSKK